MTALNITNLDTGAGSTGKLTIMDIESKEIWQSDDLNTLYVNATPFPASPTSNTILSGINIS